VVIGFGRKTEQNCKLKAKSMQAQVFLKILMVNGAILIKQEKKFSLKAWLCQLF
jgi:hypothetical protein